MRRKKFTSLTLPSAITAEPSRVISISPATTSSIGRPSMSTIRNCGGGATPSRRRALSSVPRRTAPADQPRWRATACAAVAVASSAT